MRIERLAACAALVAMVSGCGGGSSGSGSGGAGTVVTPQPTPSPSPTTPPGPTLLNIASTTMFPQLASILLYARDGAGTVSAFTTYPPEASQTFSWDATGNSWGFYFSASNIAPYNIYPNFVVERFGSAQRVAARSDAAFTVYERADAGALYSLSLLNPGASNPQLALSYVGIGSAQGSSSAAGTVDYRAFSYGYYAEASAVPGTGTGTYTGVVIGRAAGASSTHVYRLTGTLVFNANFVDKSFSGTVTLTGTDDRSGTTVSFGTFPITMNTFAQPLNYVSGYIGAGRDMFRAYMGGPAAEEMAGTFTLAIPDPQASGSTLTAVAAVGARR